MSDSIAYLNSVSWLGSKLGLQRMEELMARMGNPQDTLPVIHLAGTNGKGSTACFLAEMLRAAGYRTGLHTSPYIQTFHERMQIDGVPISDAALDRAVAQVRPRAAAMDDHPTTFELVSAAAFSWFAEARCDVVVLETGLGGSLDATNCVKKPLLTVITPIGLDHMDFLGNTIEEIAENKAGILKSGVPVVTARQLPEAMAVLERVAAERESPLIPVDLSQLRPGRFDLDGQAFDFGALRDLSTGLLGSYQLENAALALTAADTLEAVWRPIPAEARRAGISAARWPGRFELAQRDPAVIVDGGHNADGAKALAGNLARYFGGREVVFVMGVLADKDYAAMVAAILPLAAHIYTVTPKNSRALQAEELALHITGCGGRAEPVETVAAALERAKQAAGPDGIVCYFGSLYGVGEARQALGLA